MNFHKAAGPHLYYTNDHEWIDFQGSIAYTGLCSFKLLGFKQIDNIVFGETIGMRKRGDIIARIIYKDYQVEAHMPVDGKLAQLNEELISGDPNILLRDLEKKGWIALIVPANSKDREQLLLPDQYHKKTSIKQPDIIP